MVNIFGETHNKYEKEVSTAVQPLKKWSSQKMLFFLDSTEKGRYNNLYQNLTFWSYDISLKDVEILTLKEPALISFSFKSHAARDFVIPAGKYHLKELEGLFQSVLSNNYQMFYFQNPVTGTKHIKIIIPPEYTFKFSNNLIELLHLDQGFLNLIITKAIENIISYPVEKQPQKPALVAKHLPIQTFANGKHYNYFVVSLPSKQLHISGLLNFDMGNININDAHFELIDLDTEKSLDYNSFLITLKINV